MTIDQRTATSGSSSSSRTFDNYDRVYRSSWHWRYTRPLPRLREWYKLWYHVVRRTALRKGSRVLEVACGQGYHVDAMRRMGFDVLGVDLSLGAIEFAQRTFLQSRYRHLDAASRMPFEDGSFDLVWSHGAGFFHYEILNAQTEAIVREHLRLVRPGGHYLIMISSDLSGAKPDRAMQREWQHTLSDLHNVLAPHGQDIRTDWFPIRRWLIGPATPNGYAIATLRVPTVRGERQ